MINANAMVQIGINQTIKAKIQKYNKKKFEKAVKDKKTEKLMGYVPMEQYSLFEEKDGGTKRNGKN